MSSAIEPMSSDSDATPPPRQAPAVHAGPVPRTLAAALDAGWLSRALAAIGHGAAIDELHTVEVIRTVATKARFSVRFAGQAQTHSLCLKGFLDVDELTARGGATMVREADFYLHVAPQVTTRVPDCVIVAVDRAQPGAIVIMRDLIAAGGTFCTAQQAFSVADVAASLEQIAQLHASRALLAHAAWITPRLPELAKAQYVSPERLQALLDGERGAGLPTTTRDAVRLVAGLRALAARDAARPQFLVHGDAHAGNLYRTAQGPGLIDWQLLQRGGWALDVGYHVPAVLAPDVATREERALLRHYLEAMRHLGCEMPAEAAAWEQYREAALYGYYLWAITQRVEPAIIALFVQRLGAAVTRHQSHRLLGVD